MKMQRSLTFYPLIFLSFIFLWCCRMQRKREIVEDFFVVKRQPWVDLIVGKWKCSGAYLFISLSSYLLSSYGVVECKEGERQLSRRSFFVVRKRQPGGWPDCWQMKMQRSLSFYLLIFLSFIFLWCCRMQRERERIVDEFFVMRKDNQVGWPDCW